MKDQLIEFKTSVLAKEKGFNINTLNFYDSNSSYTECILKEKTIHTPDSYYHHRDCFMAPTQSLLQRWLREVHNIHIEVKNNPHSQGLEGLWEYLTTPIFEKDHILNSLDTPFRIGNGCGLATYELVLEAGLQKALELI